MTDQRGLREQVARLVESAIANSIASDWELARDEATDAILSLAEVGRGVSQSQPISGSVPLPAREAELSAAERHELDCLRHRVQQLAYPCSPHCDGYLREQALRNAAPTDAVVSAGMVAAQMESVDKPFLWSNAVRAAYRAMLAVASSEAPPIGAAGNAEAALSATDDPPPHHSDGEGG